MPIEKRWSKMTADKLEDIPEEAGVYELSGFGSDRALYIGQTKNLRRRLRAHHQNFNPNQFRFQTAGVFDEPEELERLHMERYVEKNGEIPPWNTYDETNNSDGWTVGGMVVGAGIAAALYFLDS
jgi:hypothetical protein